MLYEVEGDIVHDPQYNIFCHQTNCLGAMGAGLAKTIALRFPAVWHRNKDYCGTRNPLGTILPVRVAPERICVNLYGQYGYGRDRNKQYTDYEALQKALDMLASRLNASSIPKEWKIAFPWRMACGLGQGDWPVVEKMLRDFSYKVKQDVYIVRKASK